MFERRGQKRKSEKTTEQAGDSLLPGEDDIRPAPPGATPSAAAPAPRMPQAAPVAPQPQPQPMRPNAAPGQALPPSAPPRASAPVVGQQPMPPRPATPSGGAQAPRPEVMRRGPDPVQPVSPPQPAAAPNYGAADGAAGYNQTTGNPSMSGYTQGTPMGMPVAESGKLIVGRDIELHGQIKNCELLVVEGVVEATLIDTKALEVTERGIFRGTAPVEKAYIAGLVEGDLIVDGHVMIRSTGVVNGNVKFDEIEIERGGRIRGSMQQMSDADLDGISSASDDAAGD